MPAAWASSQATAHPFETQLSALFPQLSREFRSLPLFRNSLASIPQALGFGFGVRQAMAPRKVVLAVDSSPVR